MHAKPYVSPGSREAARRRASARKAEILDYCARHGLPEPTTTEAAQQIYRLSSEELFRTISQYCHK